MDEFLSVAVIDTGLSPEVAESCLTLPGVNLTSEGDGEDTSDLHGHGSQVAKTILKRAPHAGLVPVKLMGRYGYLRSPEQLEAAFEWILQHRRRLRIGLVCAAFADAGNSVNDETFLGSPLQGSISALREFGVAAVAPAGNNLLHGNRPGMAWPAILREVVSVGALSSDEAELTISRSSHRLHAQVGTGCRTTVFVRPEPPGGTSGAAAVVAGRLASLKNSHPEMSVDRLLHLLLRQQRSARDGSPLLWPALGNDDSPATDSDSRSPSCSRLWSRS